MDLKLTSYQGLAGKKIHGGTTVSGTMVLSQLAGIKIFGTGGLGEKVYDNAFMHFNV